jgi:hypothetical protein
MYPPAQRPLPGPVAASPSGPLAPLPRVAGSSTARESRLIPIPRDPTGKRLLILGKKPPIGYNLQETLGWPPAEYTRVKVCSYSTFFCTCHSSLTQEFIDGVISHTLDHARSMSHQKESDLLHAEAKVRPHDIFIAGHS